MMFIWQNNVLQFPIAHMVLLDNEHSFYIGSSKKVYIHIDSVLSDMPHIGCQLFYGFTMVMDLQHVSE